MRKELIKAFHNAMYESDGDLAKNIWNTLAIREKRIARLKFFAFSFIGFISLIGLVPAFIALFDDFAQSGFYEYLSLIFSNNGAIVSYWKELAFSLGESLPVMSLIISFSLIFIFFLSLRYAMKQIIKGQLSLSF